MVARTGFEHNKGSGELMNKKFNLLIVLTVSLIGCRTADEMINVPEERNLQLKKKEPQTINKEMFTKKLSDEGNFVVILTHPACGVSKRLKSKIKSSSLVWDDVYYMTGEKGSADEAFMSSYLPFTGAWPTIFAVKNSRVIDIIEGPNSMSVINQFIDRNIRPKTEAIHLEKPMENDDFRSILVHTNYNTPKDLSGIDLSNTVIKNRSFSGFNLQNVNFENSTLDRVSFSKSNLEGAKFSNSNLTHIFWGDTICPDGTESAKNNYKCIIKDNTSSLKEEYEPLAAKPQIRTTKDGRIYLDDFLKGTAWMFSKKNETQYLEPQAMDREAAYKYILSNKKNISQKIKSNPDHFEYYLFESTTNQKSFILVVPANRDAILPKETTMYKYE